MRIHATPTTDNTGIALDVDHPHNLHITGPDFIPRGVALTLDEAADLHAELGRLLSRKRTATLKPRPPRPSVRTAADVLTWPEPGDRIDWTDGTLWLVIEPPNDDLEVTFDETSDDRKTVERVVMPLHIWSPPFPEREGVCVPHP